MTVDVRAIPIDGPGADIEFCVRFTRFCTFVLTKIFRCSLPRSMFDHVEFDKSGIWVANHSNGLWGIIDVLMVCYFWYGVCEQRKPVAFMSDARVFKVPVVGYFVRRLGFKVSSIKSVRNCLAAGNWAVIPPGGNTDQLRSIWYRNQTRMYKLQYRNGEFVRKPQTWFIHAAAQLNVNAYPIACSGAHEVTPILWESKSILLYSGLIRLRGGEFWPGFPVTANHFINLYLFYLTGWMVSPIAWFLFLFANIYIDLFYSYPIFFPKVSLQAGKKMELRYSTQNLSLRQRQNEDVGFLRALNLEVNRCLENMNNTRPLMGKVPCYKAEIGF